MFETVPVEDLVATLGGHDFGAALEGPHDQQMGSERIDAIVALERIRRWTDAALAAQTVALDSQRRALANPQPVLGGGFIDEGQIARSLIGEIAMARQMSTTGAETQYGFALGLRHLPRTAGLLADGTISQRVAKAVVDEVRPLTATQTRQVDERLAPDLHLLTARRAAQAARRLVTAWTRTPPTSAPAKREPTGMSVPSPPPTRWARSTSTPPRSRPGRASGRWTPTPAP